VRRGFALLVLAAWLAWPFGAGAELATLPRLATLQPWPWATRLIEYDGRLWFAATVRLKEHNSADLYSYDPARGEARYEHHLFSQDVGQPAVHQGLLYWPCLDSRFSAGWADLAATDGRDWWWGPIRGPRSFHALALASIGGRLYAATSAWKADLQASDDGGLTWRTVYSRAGRGGDASRVTELAVLGEDLYMVVRDGTSEASYALLRLSAGLVGEVPGWPHGPKIEALAVWREQVYAIVKEPSGRPAVWATDGRSSRRLAVFPAPAQARGLAAGADSLFAVSYHRDGGTVWRSGDGIDWHQAARVVDGEPVAIALLDGRPYVGGRSADGLAALWGPAPVASAPGGPSSGARAELPRRATPGGTDWQALGTALDAALADPRSYESGDRALRDLIYDAAAAGAPSGFFAGRLDAEVPDLTLSLFGGATEASAAERARWLLLWGAAVNGGDRIEPRWLALPWTTPENARAKYFATTPAALWAAAVGRQRDRETIDVLIDRLALGRDPDWLKGDVVGALSAITGERFAYDAEAWRLWWSAARAGWPPQAEPQ
jgi:hypothetical protein